MMSRFSRDRPRYDYDYYPRYSPAKPLEAKDGIQAKSKTGRIGETWWAQRFIQALDAFSQSNRLARGKSYARSGQVMNLEVQPGSAKAKVQGTRRTPYKVEIAVTPFTDAHWKRVEKAMSEDALCAARLLAGEMPHEIQDLLAQAGVSLFPATGRDMQTSCSCPDYANPCKHVAATFYILGEKFDEDPFLMLTWRGRARERLLDDLRALRGSDTPLAVDAPRVPEVAPVTVPLDESFWKASKGLQDLVFQPVHSPTPDALLRLLGPLKAGEVDLVAPLRDLVARIAEEGESRAYRE
jgi:uncharacterized Zn finger protein